LFHKEADGRVLWNSGESLSAISDHRVPMSLTIAEWIGINDTEHVDYNQREL